MFSVISKKDYWNALDGGVVKPRTARLKDIQDAFVLHQLNGVTGARILELGGGNSRILAVLVRTNDCWNIDRFEGLGQGPVKAESAPGIRLVKEYMGTYSGEIPADYFDYVVSVSALEHVPTPFFRDVITDCKRVLKIGGSMIHAVDLYLFDSTSDHPQRGQQKSRLELYRSIPDLVEGGLTWLKTPEVDATVTASARFASNHMDELHAWNKLAPKLAEVREIAQSCSLKLGLRRVA